MPKPTIASLQTQLVSLEGQLASLQSQLDKCQLDLVDARSALRTKDYLLVALRNSLAKSPFSFLLPKFVKNWVFEERKALAKQFGAE